MSRPWAAPGTPEKVGRRPQFRPASHASITSGTESPTGTLIGTCTRTRDTPALPGQSAALLTGAHTSPILTITPVSLFGPDVRDPVNPRVITVVRFGNAIGAQFVSTIGTAGADLLIGGNYQLFTSMNLLSISPPGN